MPATIGDIDAALTYAAAHTLPDRVDIAADLVALRVRPGEDWQQIDLRHLRPAPGRSTGTVLVYDAESFALAVERLAITDIGGGARPKPVVYVDPAANELTAVLNDDTATAPGWRDHRVALELRRTPEWAAWIAGQDYGPQRAFAERIEDGMPEIVTPSGAVMLELAQTFHATIDVKFRSGARLADGSTQFLFDEDVKASAGSSPGSLTIPELFTIGVAPFVGSDVVAVDARLRYRLRSGDLAIGYFLVRAEAVELDAFGSVVASVRDFLDESVLFLNGPAPTVAAAE